MLPEVENPIPKTIGLSFIFGAAGAGGVLALVLAISSGAFGERRDEWTRRGTACGFAIGLAVYLAALYAQLL